MNRRFLLNKYGDLSIFSHILDVTIKFFLKNEYRSIFMFEKKIITGNVYFASTRKGIIKELCGIYKVFLLLNECGDPPFYFKI